MKSFRLFHVLLFGGAAIAGMVPGPRMDVVVYNNAAVPDSLLHPAAEVAISIFEKAGATLAWHDCRGPACVQGGPNFLVVNLMQSRNNPRLKWPQGGCGMALASGDSGFYAFVDYQCVVALGGSSKETGSLLGHVIAHEIGHLLLGDRSHSAAGLMKKQWLIAERTHMNQHSLSFKSEEAARIRAALRRRFHVSAPVAGSASLAGYNEIEQR